MWDTTFEWLEELIGGIGVVTELQAWLLVVLCLAAFALGACIREYMMEHSLDVKARDGRWINGVSEKRVVK